MTIRLLVADDQELVRAGLVAVLSTQPDFDVVAEAADGIQAVEEVRRHRPDVALVDIRMPHLDGIGATAEICTDSRLATRVLILTTFDLDEYVLAALRAGASGFLLKDAPPEEMLAAIRTVHDGDAVIAPSSTRRLLEHLVATLPPDEPGAPADPARLAVAELTDREREVLVLMARGRSNTEIGTDLFVAEATVKTHVGRILAKLSARDRVQAVVTAYETGLVRPGDPS